VRNSGALGHGCQNSAATGGAQLRATGTSSPDALVLQSSGQTQQVLTVFLQGDVSIAPINFGDGLRCIGGHLLRLSAKIAIGSGAAYPDCGEPPITVRAGELGDTIPRGSSRSYQVYYRDANPTFCPNPPGNTWNVSHGITIVW